ncbi:DUF1028 domain-containing protein [Ornithinibacillus sp. 4-3]|uniref:DUF1028 domain-containing protein n=1 Tax=Ornithinibacillus sp. 4-3 TaxID=3231488 RepID=A0AB39HJJ7_9BACI
MTFSITARCEKTGQFGIAISTRVIGVGSRCPYAKAGVGAVTSQASSNPYLGINGLKALEQGMTAEEALQHVLAQDPAIDVRQVSVVDAKGNVAVHTGENCVGWFGHRTGKNYVAMGNMLVGEDTVLAMAETFEENIDMDLSERLLKSLEAAQAAGGDKRGRQSAALYVVNEEEYPYMDLRVDEHVDPVQELRRIFTLAQEQLVPRMKLMPTKKNPAGINDRAAMEKVGLIEEEK